MCRCGSAANLPGMKRFPGKDASRPGTKRVPRKDASRPAMKRFPGKAVSGAPHGVLVERIVSMQGAVQQSVRAEHLHVRDALNRLRSEERALRSKLHGEVVLHRAGRKI